MALVQKLYARAHNQGKGLIASEHIPAGTKIVTERPVYSTLFTFILTSPSTTEEQFCAGEMARLSPNIYNHVLSLSNQHPQCLDNGHWVSTPISGTIRTNLIPFSLGRYQPRADRLGLFLTISRCNHACLPNAAQTWNKELDEEVLYALQDIEPGQQITISYSPEARIDPAWVKKVFGFECACRYCLAPDTPAKTACLTNRNDIEDLSDDFQELEDPKKALKNCYLRALIIQAENITDWRKGLVFEDALDLMIEEFHDSERGKLLAVLAFLAYWKCEGWETSKGTELGEKYSRLYGGVMDEDTGVEYLFEMVERHVNDPKSSLAEGVVVQRSGVTGGDENENVPVFNPENFWEELSAPLLAPQGEVEEDGDSVYNFSSILAWLFMVK